ncbi:NAD(+) diphosphatase [Microbacterium dextranolyticum]|uniref:NAD(+) diphosphatase n=1 Tax=Microbacterium dextranolyticum TaxID=36806 RepID=A0A9W6M691_9MICO|nr:NAD(+) diphosphatase [Microbacterium dextranolyticum]MBM7463269.1 NAD+ diphosphatase [Microbacterium dextranolyticum]GLJ95626.1 NADH pyrophosphatase [Microbacterium dextranolyticum]
MHDSRAVQPPALARAGIDRRADERDRPGLVEALRQREDTRVVTVVGDRTLVTEDGTALATVPPASVCVDARWALLGRDDAGAAVLLAAVAAAESAPEEAVRSTPEGGRWAALRVVGGELDPVEAGVFVEAVALARWLVDAAFCPACGASTELRAAGWSRHCPACGRDHFPRTDPAVIVAVQSEDGERLLLGQNAQWVSRNVYSTFAGFVEAGESLESTIEREIFEEAGVVITDPRYRGSQAWPYPRSIMLGFLATVVGEAVPRPDGDEIVAVRWFTRHELSTALADPAGADFALPGTASIAYRLIVDWVEGAR